MTNMLPIITNFVTKILMAKYNKDKIKIRLLIMLPTVTKILYIKQNE